MFLLDWALTRQPCVEEAPVRSMRHRSSQLPWCPDGKSVATAERLPRFGEARVQRHIYGRTSELDDTGSGDSRQIRDGTVLASFLPTGSHEVRRPRAQATLQP